MKHLFLKKGVYSEFIDHEARRVSGFYDLQKWFKRVLRYFNVPFLDPCCTEGETILPVRFNSTTGNLERYDIATGTWIIVDTANASNPTWVTVTTNATVAPSQYYTLANATSGNITLTLPTPALAQGIYTIKKTDASANTVGFSQPIDGNAGFVLDSQNESVSILSNGTAYYIL